MKRLSLALFAALSVSVLGLSGCGGSGETKVIENTNPQANEMPAEQQNQYEQYMKEQQQRGN
jgi:hypothetical protein